MLGLPRFARPLALLALAAVAVSSVACSVHRRVPVTGRGQGAPFATGMASWYGPKFHGRRTANGERYDMHQLTAAHPTLPFDTEVEVVNLDNGKSVAVRINDRGPFAKGRIIDLSYAAAQAIDLVGPGTARVALYVTGRSLPRYTVQVGAFSDYARAVALHEQLARTYPEVFVHSEGSWHRVQVGNFEDRDAAEALQRELAMAGVDGMVVVK